MSASALVLGAAFLLDASIGEPPNALHPVVWMGHAIEPLKRMHARGPALEFAIGALVTLLVTSGFGFGAWALVHFAPHPVLALAIEVFLLFSSFASRGLLAAGAAMAHALARGDLSAARAGLASLCSRDPGELGPEELAGATVESLSENASDSVVAPLLYFALFGVAGAVFYRAANTLDAMVGYRGRYEYRGKFAARLDDLLNLAPARITAVLLLLAGALQRRAVGRGLAVGLRDRGRTESPNAGWPMAVTAGLLGVRLDKRGAYVLGPELERPTAVTVREAVALVQCTSWLAVCSAVAVLAARRLLD